MSLDKFYSLRTEFTIIGLTGRVGAGCSEIAQKLADSDFARNLPDKKNSTPATADDLKLNICYKYLKQSGNWIPFKIINYKEVLLLHLLHEANYNNTFPQAIESMIDIICQNGETTNSEYTNRLDKTIDEDFLEGLRFFLSKYEQVFANEKIFGCCELIDCFKGMRRREIFEFYFGEAYSTFAKDFFVFINSYSVTKRTRLTHDLACNLRACGSVRNPSQRNIEYIYTIAETINRLIKAWRECNDTYSGTAKIVIDALKNSLELMYFKEKYSGFYMVASNKEDSARIKYVNDSIFKTVTLKHLKEDIKKKFAEEIINLDNSEYECKDYKKGIFSVPDIENCIQKSDFHIFIDSVAHNSAYLSLDDQIAKLISLIHQPGIITPTNIERTMQVAYNAKYNSGCISRQVGAVVTDNYFSIKAIGWNDVPQGQVPCNLRNVEDLINNKNELIFSAYEKEGKIKGVQFKERVKEEIEKRDLSLLNGKNCSFCFKSFQNAFEGEKNQVHTRSLHAEENAMLQIAKNGGQGLKGGNLFTTASPCELCSKKAFQLGIKNIYYIDPYPGISRTQILKAGVNPESNPQLLMFQGAVGRAFHKLYEPFLAYKDEIKLITGIDPQQKKSTFLETLSSLIEDSSVKREFEEKCKERTQEEQKKIFNLMIQVGIDAK